MKYALAIKSEIPSASNSDHALKDLVWNQLPGATSIFEANFYDTGIEVVVHTSDLTTFADARVVKQQNCQATLLSGVSQ